MDCYIIKKVKSVSFRSAPHVTTPSSGSQLTYSQNPRGGIAPISFSGGTTLSALLVKALVLVGQKAVAEAARHRAMRLRIILEKTDEVAKKK